MNKAVLNKHFCSMYSIRGITYHGKAETRDIEKNCIAHFEPAIKASSETSYASMTAMLCLKPQLDIGLRVMSALPAEFQTAEGLRTLANFLRSQNGIKVRSAIEHEKRVDYFKGRRVPGIFFSILATALFV